MAQNLDVALADAAEPRLRRPVSLALALGIFGAFLGYYGLLCFRHQGWGGDFQMYCAGISRLYRNFWHPLHEAMDVPGTESTVYTAYLVIVAAFGKLLGASPYRALEVAGVANLLLYAASVAYLFSRHSLLRRWWLSAACFIFTSLFVRWLHFGWSSEVSLTNLQYIQPYPSTLGWALAFVCFGLMQDLSSHARLRELLALGGVLGLSLVTHLITASWAVGIVGLHALWVAVQHRDWRVPARALAALALGVGLAAVWPYAPLFSQLGLSGVNERTDFGVPLHDMPNLYALALPCYAYLLLRLRRHGFWLLGMFASWGALLLWRSVGLQFGNRYSFFTAFFAHFALAELMALGIFALLGPLTEVTPARRWPRLDGPFAIAMLGLTLVSWLPSPMLVKARNRKDFGRLTSPRALLRQGSPLEEYYARFSELRPYLSSADLVLTPVSRDVFDLASITGAQVISAPNAHQVVDRHERRRDVDQFFDPTASVNERLDVLDHRRPTKLLLPSAQFGLLEALVQQFREPTYQGPDYALWDLASPRVCAALCPGAGVCDGRCL